MIGGVGSFLGAFGAIGATGNYLCKGPKRRRVMIDEIKELERRAFQSWEDDFTATLIVQQRLTRVGCATFTMAKKKHTQGSAFTSILDDYFYQLAKKHKRHFISLHGTPSIGATERMHQHGDIFVFNHEGEIKNLESFRWLLEASFSFGRCLIEKKRTKTNRFTGKVENSGSWSGYSVSKHDGNDNFFKIYCPKIGDCGKHTKQKGDRRFCVYQRNAIKLT